MRKTEIIIPVHNQVFFTAQVVREIREKTFFPYHLTVVDNASTDETPDILEKLGVHSIRCSQNLGFGRAVNKGMREVDLSETDVVILNNDLLLTRGWLGSLQSVLKLREGVGIVAPVTNRAASSQAMYPDLMEPHIEILARLLREVRPTPVEVPCVTGVCMLIQGECLREIGLFDEIFVLAGEDFDLCYRARAAGWKVLVDRSTLIFHFKHITANSCKCFDMQAEWKKSKDLFESRWGRVPHLLPLERGIRWKSP